MATAHTAAPRTALEQSIIALAETQGLLTVGIDYHNSDDHDRRWFNVGLQWRDETMQHRRDGVTGSGETIAEALANALTALAAKRADTFADEALPVELAA